MLSKDDSIITNSIPPTPIKKPLFLSARSMSDEIVYLSIVYIPQNNLSA